MSDPLLQIGKSNIFLVGGAVRDGLLGQPIHERDWVIVGSQPDSLRALGFKQVGHCFPVFLHPDTQEEYALARTEKKSGPKHVDFICDFGEMVTLEDDLSRRDLTINAIAKNQEGALIDPWGGIQDIANKRLRHVSPAFCEDPLRVLRVARFRTTAWGNDFSIVKETEAIMRQMSQSGQLGWLTQERIWRETSRAFMNPFPGNYFSCLYECGALDFLDPAIADLFTPSKKKYFALFEKAAPQLPSLLLRFGLLYYCLRLANQTQSIPTEQLLTSFNHCPINAIREFSRFVFQTNPPDFQADLSENVSEALKWMDNSDAWRRPDRIVHYLSLLSCEALQLKADCFAIPKRSTLQQLNSILESGKSVRIRAEELTHLPAEGCRQYLRAKRLHHVLAKLYAQHTS